MIKGVIRNIFDEEKFNPLIFTKFPYSSVISSFLYSFTNLGCILPIVDPDGQGQ